MKNLLRLFAFAVCAFFGTTFADNFKSKVVGPGAQLQINLAGDDTLLIRNFTQEADASPTRGVVQVTKAGDTANVLTAAILGTSSSTEEVINSVVIQGPAVVMVTCNAVTGNCFISYKKQGD